MLPTGPSSRKSHCGIVRLNPQKMTKGPAKWITENSYMFSEELSFRPGENNKILQRFIIFLQSNNLICMVSSNRKINKRKRMAHIWKGD